MALVPIGGGSGIQSWEAGPYGADVTVAHGGKLWRSNVSTEGEPGVSEDWVDLGVGGGGGGVHVGTDAPDPAQQPVWIKTSV